MPSEEERAKTLHRIFNDINDTKQKLAGIDAKMCQIIEFKDMVHKVIYGNGKDGLVTKISKCLGIQNLQWALFVLFIIALVTILGR